MISDFQRQYAELQDDQLLQVASDRASLVEEAKDALDAEMRNRNLTSADLARYQRFVKRNEELETRRRNRKLFGHRRSLRAWLTCSLWWAVVLFGATLVMIWLGRR